MKDKVIDYIITGQHSEPRCSWLLVWFTAYYVYVVLAAIVSVVADS